MWVTGSALDPLGDQLGHGVDPDVAWAKLRALTDGAKIASERLWRSR